MNPSKPPPISADELNRARHRLAALFRLPLGMGAEAEDVKAVLTYLVYELDQLTSPVGGVAAPPLQVRLLRPGAKLPVGATARSAGVDLHACLGNQDDSTLSLDIQPGFRTTIPTGIAVAVPAGHVGLCCSRSGLARHHGLAVLNAPGVVDEDFRGEMAVILINLGQAPVTIKHGDRIAQLVISPVVYAPVETVAELAPTERGEAGFGSSGR